MKRFFTVLVLLAVTTFVFAKTGNKNKSVSYTFESQDLDGNKITSDIFSNNIITMINIWGTFCGPCIREMPELA